MSLIRQLWRRNQLHYCIPWLHSYSSHLSPSSPVVSAPRLSRLGFVSRSTVVDSIHHSSLHNFFNVSCFTTHAAVEHTIGTEVDVPLAQTGEGIAECELLKWFVQEGDQVEEFQPLCEVQSDKATIEITSRYRGKISHILHAPGDIVKVGETLLKMAVQGSSPSPANGFSEPILNEPSNHDKAHGQASLSNDDRLSGVLCTPSVRNLAKQYGININDIKGTGTEGRILKEDILNYVRGSEPSDDSDKLVSESSLHEDKIVKLRGFQRAMVKSMTMAARVPHFHYVEEIYCESLVKLKSSFQKETHHPNVKHTYLPFLVKSLSMALSNHQLLNSCFDEDTNEIIVKGSHNIGIAMATPNGLVVPNVKRVQSLSILEITNEITRLQQLALENKLSHDDVSGGTITLSNIGTIGGKFGSPLINLPEVAIIAIGRIHKVPHFTDDGTVYPTPIMNVNIGADHRILDGAAVAKFCNDWKSYIEKPELLLLHMK